MGVLFVSIITRARAFGLLEINFSRMPSARAFDLKRTGDVEEDVKKKKLKREKKPDRTGTRAEVFGKTLRRYKFVCLGVLFFAVRRRRRRQITEYRLAVAGVIAERRHGYGVKKNYVHIRPVIAVFARIL